VALRLNDPTGSIARKPVPAKADDAPRTTRSRKRSFASPLTRRILTVNVLALAILAFGATGLDILPVLGLHDKDAASFTTAQYVWDTIVHSILPVAILTYGGLAYLSRQMRVGMLEVIRQDYIRTARAKGLSERVVVLKHALRNSLIPVVTLLASILPILIGGSVIVETIFTIPGMGLYAFDGLVQRDYNVVMATATAAAFMTLIGFLLSDVAYALVDPRIAYD